MLKPGVSVEFLWEVSEKISFTLFMDFNAIKTRRTLVADVEVKRKE